MKILVLTNEDHIEFVSKFIFPYNSEHDVHAYYDDKPYLFADIKYDIGVSFMYLSKVPKEQIDTHTWFNFHPAPLPEYKGRNLCYHALRNGAKEFGATIHYMDDDFDTGDIIEVFPFSILDDYTANDVSILATKFSEQLFVEYFPRIIAGEQFKRFPNVGGTYYKKNTINDFIELNHSDYHIKNEIRAITHGDFYPKIDIGGVTYKIVKDE